MTRRKVNKNYMFWGTKEEAKRKITDTESGAGRRVNAEQWGSD
jgi:hypothetical protein